MARPRTPSAILELKGAFKKDPQRKEQRSQEPRPQGIIGDPPLFFDVERASIWHEIISQVPDGVLTNADRIILELTCSLVHGLRQGSSERGDLSLLKSCLASLGMTPADRSKISVPKQAEELDEFAKIAAETARATRPN
jgi:hypothetical protein